MNETQEDIWTVMAKTVSASFTKVNLTDNDIIHLNNYLKYYPEILKLYTQNPNHPNNIAKFTIMHQPILDAQKIIAFFQTNAIGNDLPESLRYLISQSDEIKMAMQNVNIYENRGGTSMEKGTARTLTNPNIPTILPPDNNGIAQAVTILITTLLLGIGLGALLFFLL